MGKHRKSAAEKAKAKKKNKSGLSFERAVATLQAMMAPDAIVTHDESIVDRLGHARQFDVVIRSNVGGHDILGVIECRDLNRKVDVTAINAFADKARNVRANLTLFVSRMGFTKQRLELARDYGIGTFSLLREPGEQAGFTIGAETFVTVRSWKFGELRVSHSPAQPKPQFGLDDVVLDDQPVMPWVVNELHTTFDDISEPGRYLVRIDLHRPAVMRLGTGYYQVGRIEAPVERVRDRRRGAVQFSGKASVDWQRGQVKTPANMPLTGTPISLTTSRTGPLTLDQNWEAFDGEIPPATGWLQMHYQLSGRWEPTGGVRRDLRTIADVSIMPAE